MRPSRVGLGSLPCCGVGMELVRDCWEYVLEEGWGKVICWVWVAMGTLEVCGRFVDACFCIEVVWLCMSMSLSYLLKSLES